MTEHSKLLILMAEDDPDDRLLTQEALAKSDINIALEFVDNGEALLDYLRGQGTYAAAPPRRPDLVLMDLNMPRKDGRETLLELKNDPEFNSIPIVIITSSHAEKDLQQSYNLGANAYITKPITFDSLVKIVKILGNFWLGIIDLPKKLP